MSVALAAVAFLADQTKLDQSLNKLGERGEKYDDGENGFHILFS